MKIDKISNYFKSNEPHAARVVSKVLTIVVTILSGLLLYNLIPKGFVYYAAMIINACGFIVKIAIPMLGSDKDDIKKLQQNQITQIPQ